DPPNPRTVSPPTPLPGPLPRKPPHHPQTDIPTRDIQPAPLPPHKSADPAWQIQLRTKGRGDRKLRSLDISFGPAENAVHSCSKEPPEGSASPALAENPQGSASRAERSRSRVRRIDRSLRASRAHGTILRRKPPKRSAPFRTSARAPSAGFAW